MTTQTPNMALDTDRSYAAASPRQVSSAFGVRFNVDIMRRFLAITMIMFFVLFGCNKQISGYEFKTRLDDSINHSAVSYWYVGGKDGCHFIQERWPLPTASQIFQIPKNEIRVLKDLKYTDDTSEWINLKIGDIVLADN